MRKMKLTKSNFQELLKKTSINPDSKACKAAQLFFCGNSELSIREAGKQVGITGVSAGRAINRIYEEHDNQLNEKGLKELVFKVPSNKVNEVKKAVKSIVSG